MELWLKGSFRPGSTGSLIQKRCWFFASDRTSKGEILVDLLNATLRSREWDSSGTAPMPDPALDSSSPARHYGPSHASAYPGEKGLGYHRPT